MWHRLSSTIGRIFESFQRLRMLLLKAGRLYVAALASVVVGEKSHYTHNRMVLSVNAVNVN